MHKIIYTLLFITIPLVHCQEEAQTKKYVGLETKSEMVSWDDVFPKSLGVGFGSTNPHNKNLLNYSENGQTVNKWFQITCKNIYNFNFENKVFNISLLGGTENFFRINNLNFWVILNSNFFDLINIGLGTGSIIVLHKFEYEEVSGGLILDLNSPIPIKLFDANFSIGINFKHIFTKYKNISSLGPYNSQIFNFYINFEVPTKIIKYYLF
mgnify:CR=1 FL=1